MLVRNAMSPEITVCSTHDSLEEVADIMRLGANGIVPVVDRRHRPVGVVTLEDIAAFSATCPGTLAEIPINQVIKGQRLICCYEDDDMEKALQLMELRKMRRLLVTDSVGVLTGILALDRIRAHNRYSKTYAAPVLQ